MVALLSEEPPRDYGDDLAAAWRAARRGSDGYGARWKAEARRLERSAAESADGGGAGAGSPVGEDAVAGLVTALAFPERVARAREQGGYLMVSGSGARLAEGSALRATPWLAVAVADRTARDATARVRLAAVLDEDMARRAAGHLRSTGEEVHWEDGDVVARSVDRLGAVELTVRPLGSGAEPVLVREALLDGLRREGLGLLRWSREAGELRERLAFLHGELGEPWPDMADESLVDRAGGGWSPSCPGPRAGRIWGGSTPVRRCGGCCRGPRARRAGWESWRRSGSRCRAVRGSGWSTGVGGRCSR